MLMAGRKKIEVFDTLLGQGVKARVLARLIASHLDPRRYAAMRIHMWIMIAIRGLLLLLILAAGASLAIDKSDGGLAFFCLVMLVIEGGIIWGFVRGKAFVYNIVLLITIAGVGRLGLAVLEHRGSIPWFVISLGYYFYLGFIRNRLFPDFQFFSPRKVSGRYLFVD